MNAGSTQDALEGKMRPNSDAAAIAFRICCGRPKSISWTGPPTPTPACRRGANHRRPWLGPIGEWALGGLLAALPVLFASLIFSTILSGRVDPARALAYNLLGAIIGGALEYSSMAIGIKGLYLLAAAVYAGALMASLRARRLA
jgi:hypothetical protein